MVLAPGTAVQRYLVEAPIGEGGMGAVYRALDTHLDRPVALKVLSDGSGGLPDKEARERLVREARAAAALSHPNAVAIFDAGDSEHGPFIVMELVVGDTLRARIGQGDTAEQVVGWMRMAALALGEAHDRGIIHRDIKPENLMIRRDGIAKVLDFGIARRGTRSEDASAPTQAALPTLTGTGVSIGTPQYMAPEQIKGKPLDGRSDQFAWAVTAYEALTGRLPWQAENGALGVVASILEEVPPNVCTLRSDVPAHVGAAIARAMEKRPEERFPTMRALVNALDGAPEDASAPAPKRISVRPPSGGVAVTSGKDTRFSEATVKAVIGKALDFDARGGYSRGELEAAAREIGISEDALAEATRAIRSEKAGAAVSREHDELLQQIRRRRLRGFLNHLIAYLGVNLIIVLPGLTKRGLSGIWPFLVPAIGWGIGLATHALRAFSKDVSPEEIRETIEREEKAIAKDALRRAEIAEKLEKHALPRHIKNDAKELGRAVEKGAGSILSDAAGQIREGHGRVRAPSGNAGGVRVGQQRTSEVALELAAEVEAEEELRKRARE